MPSDSSSSAYISSCPFCNISQAYAPLSPIAITRSTSISSKPTTTTSPFTSSQALSSSSAAATGYSTSVLAPRQVICAAAEEVPEQTELAEGEEEEESAYTILSTPSVLAFLDHMPITRGHVLVTTRQHREKLSDVTLAEAALLGAWLSVLSRAIMRAVGMMAAEQSKDTRESEGWDGEFDVKDWNVVQNNGARAAQVVNHVHYHIIPRPGDVVALQNRSWTMFGRGQRGDLDDDEALLVRDRIRVEISREVQRLSRAERRILGVEEGVKL